MVWMEAAVAYFPCYFDIRLKGLRKTTRNLSQDSQSPILDSNQSPLKQKREMLPLELTCSEMDDVTKRRLGDKRRIWTSAGS
jgi:hypothetical protein